MALDWTNIEINLIVEDYFSMLRAELAGYTYSKSSHRRALLPLLNGRTKGSIEFKHQNISAVLARLGQPFIRGYLPRYNNLKTKKLRGNVIIGPPERSFCFIKTNKTDSYFCYKSELPEGIKSDQLIEFDIKKSFDKKKQVDSWKAVNVRILSS